MSNHTHSDNAPDQAAIQEADAIWHQFTKGTQYLVIGVVGVLILMAITLL